MSVFGTILDKLGFKKRPAKTTPSKPIPQTAPPAPSQTAQSRPAPQTTQVKPPQPAQTRPAPPATTTKPPQRAPQPRDSRAAPRPSMPPVRPGASTTPAAGVPAAKPAAVPMVDVVSKLDSLAAANPQELNWKVSIVDLLKLLDMDSSLQARKELATELEIPPDIMADNKSMNIWLHKTVLQKLAENGGNVPRELLD